MSEAPQCPYCGLSLPGGGHALDSLYQEVRRIRAIAEARPAEGAAARPLEARHAEAGGRAAGEDRRRVEELTREVQELRITVARLRGMAVPGVVRSA